MNPTQPTHSRNAHSPSVSAPEAQNINRSHKDISTSGQEELSADTPRCIHYDQPPYPATGQEAYSDFLKCMDKHLFPMVSQDLMTEEDGLKTIATELDNLLKEEELLMSMVENRVTELSNRVRATRRVLSNRHVDTTRDGARDGVRDGARNSAKNTDDVRGMRNM